MDALASMLEDVHALGLLVQASGAGLIALLSVMLYRAAGHASLLYWSWGWAALLVALSALLMDRLVPAWEWWTQPLYLLGEYLFLYLLWLGCVHYTRGTGPRRAHMLLLAPALALALTLPQVSNGQFQPLFALQSVLLAAGFGASLFALRDAPAGAGLTAVRVALLLLTLTFAHYVPMFAQAAWMGAELPMPYLKLTSVAHLLFEFVLGVSAGMLVLERIGRELADARQRLQELAVSDPLTGALNRHAFNDYMRLLAPDAGGSLALLDLDRLKYINDHLGHHAGDLALKAMARVLGCLQRQQDQLFRWGGDEFLLVAPGVSPEALGRQLAGLNTLLEREAALSEFGTVRLEVSYGVAAFVEAGALIASIQAADQRMYENRHARRGSTGHGRQDDTLQPEPTNPAEAAPSSGPRNC